MKSFGELQEETRAVQLSFLLTDIGAANTFLDVAHTTGDAATRVRNVQHAQEAYSMIARMSGRVQMSSEDGEDLRVKLEMLKKRLDAMEASGKEPSR